MTEQELVERLERTGQGADLLALIDKLGFKRAFVAETMFGGTLPISVAQIAMLWMGMPNKHDRKRTKQLCEALADAGLLARTSSEDSYDVTIPTS